MTTYHSSCCDLIRIKKAHLYLITSPLIELSHQRVLDVVRAGSSLVRAEGVVEDREEALWRRRVGCVREHSTQHHEEARKLLPDADPPLSDVKGVVGLASGVLDFALRPWGDAVNERLVRRQFVLHLEDVRRELWMWTAEEPEAHQAVQASQSDEITFRPQRIEDSCTPQPLQLPCPLRVKAILQVLLGVRGHVGRHRLQDIRVLKVGCRDEGSVPSSHWRHRRRTPIGERLQPKVVVLISAGSCHPRDHRGSARQSRHSCLPT